jgi:predicted extracellular nuclease
MGVDGPRTLTPPDVGEVIISEVFANPDGSDAGRDWVEFYNTTDVTLDLNGLTIEAHKTTGSMTDETIESDGCISVAPGGYVVIGGQGAAAEGVPTAATVGSATATLFYVSDLTLKLVSDSGTILDETAGPFDPTSGASYSLDPAQLNATANNDLNNWCVATQSVPAELPLLGTPGSVNPICGE